MSENPLVWAFDLGKGSIGEAIRKGDHFLHKESLLIPEDFAETRTATKRRRMMRTRIAHQEREKWLKEVLKTANIEILESRKTVWNPEAKKMGNHTGDPRLEREFPDRGDVTCYTSCLLRIKLLRDEKLEPWQIYKALHSAIQRRGYDPDIPWKSKEGRREKKVDEDEAGTLNRMKEFIEVLEQMAPNQPSYHFPCYFDAWKMGLWNPSAPNILRDRIDCRAESTRNQIIPRYLVEKELRALVEAAAKQYPGLKDKTDYLLYGPAGKAYASYYPETRRKYHLKQGGTKDWSGF